MDVYVYVEVIQFVRGESYICRIYGGQEHGVAPLLHRHPVQLGSDESHGDCVKDAVDQSFREEVDVVGHQDVSSAHFMIEFTMILLPLEMVSFRSMVLNICSGVASRGISTYLLSLVTAAIPLTVVVFSVSVGPQTSIAWMLREA